MQAPISLLCDAQIDIDLGQQPIVSAGLHHLSQQTLSQSLVQTTFMQLLLFNPKT